MRFLLNEIDPFLRAGLFFAVGIAVGNLVSHWIIRLTEYDDEASSTTEPRERGNSEWWHRLPLIGCFLARGQGRYRGATHGFWWLLVELATGALFAGFTYAYLDLGCQKAVMVSPSDTWKIGRLFYHLILIALLITATGTDFRDFTISDWITLPGILIGVVAATFSGELQTMHLWVDWNDPYAGLRGAYIPAWIDLHRHWHGLAWSVTGMAAGGGITWLVRAISKLILSQEAMGFGDVTLMAMIGSFIGWQPVLFVFLLAPLCGLVVSMTVRLTTGRTFLPFGPYLSAAAMLVLFSWRWIWELEVPISADRDFSVRLFMGDWQGLLFLAAFALTAFIFLMGMVRLYRTVPTGRNAGNDND